MILHQSRYGISFYFTQSYTVMLTYMQKHIFIIFCNRPCKTYLTAINRIILHYVSDEKIAETFVNHIITFRLLNMSAKEYGKGSKITIGFRFSINICQNLIPICFELRKKHLLKRISQLIFQKIGNKSSSKMSTTSLISKNIT